MKVDEPTGLIANLVGLNRGICTNKVILNAQFGNTRQYPNFGERETGMWSLARSALKHIF